MSAGELIVLLIFLGTACLLGMWAATDASRRGKNPLFVIVAVVFFFPMGLVAWLLFRPALQRTSE